MLVYMLLTKKPHLDRPGRWLAWRITSIVVVGTMIAFLIGSSWFLYSYVFRTLEDANIILTLNPALEVDVLNIEIYNRAEDALTLKQTPVTVPNSIRNIFSFVSSTAPHATSSSRP